MGKGTGSDNCLREALYLEIDSEPGLEESLYRGKVIKEVLDMNFPEVYEVGGCIRDQLLGKAPKDIDIAVVGVSIDELLEKTKGRGKVKELVVSGKKIGVRIYGKWTNPEGIELALARTEVSTGPGHTDFDIRPDKNIGITEDLARRDFTCNAIARNLSTQELVDPFGGIEDTRNLVLRIVSPNSFRDDPLRVLRGIARMAKDNFKPDPQTFEKMAQWAPSLSQEAVDAKGEALIPLTGERIKEELDKTLSGKYAAQALRVARDAGVLEKVLPEISETIGFDQESKYHQLSCDQHILLVLEKACMEDASLRVRWAALLHDSGKPASAWRGKDERLHFYQNKRSRFIKGEDGLPLQLDISISESQDSDQYIDCPKSHELIGEDKVYQVATRLKFPSQLRDSVGFLVRNHMYTDDNNFDKLSIEKQQRKARRFIHRIGREYVEDLMLLRRCDRAGKQTGTENIDGWDTDITSFEKSVRSQIEAPLTTKELSINGHDLLDLGFQGAAISQAQNTLLKRVVDTPEHNQPERLLAWAKKLPRSF